MIYKRALVIILLACACLLAFAPSVDAQISPLEQVKPSSPNETLRSAQTIFIRSKSLLLKSAALEEALLSRSEFQQWGMVITRDEMDADLIIEVKRKSFSNRFVYSVIDPKTSRVLMGGKIGSLGGTVEEQIANGFVQRLKKVRPLN
jgi:hypothetical protein